MFKKAGIGLGYLAGLTDNDLFKSTLGDQALQLLLAIHSPRKA